MEYQISRLPDLSETSRMDGIEAARRIKKVSSATAALMLTVLEDDEFIARSIEAGASAYLMKSTRGHDVIQAVRAACDRGLAPSS